MTRIAIALAFWGALTISAAPSASDLARLVTQIALDPDACYHVTEINFSKDDLQAQGPVISQCRALRPR